jgi:acyl-coenzyme A synthetase/AMP-(fatty) acid ligase/aryl carrier-like protein
MLGLGFDAAALEIWAHLCAGATLCLPDETERSSAELIQAWMIRERVTISLVPAILGARLMTLQWPSNSALRMLIVGGDVLHHGPPAQLPFKVVNHYGPTECTVVATWATLTPGSDELPPIGCPIDGATVYLLDDQGEQVPEGTVGEIYIGGRGVGRGYRNLPALTEQSFLPDLFSGVAGATIYRTGDLAKRRPDGELEFHGRRDRQVKIRGQRVELDEIGSVLMHHPDISFAVAVERLSDNGEKYLTAYILLNDGVSVPTARELQEYLLHCLPDYMIPSTFARLHFIPTSTNGKVDFARLAGHGDLLPMERTQEAPATLIEERLLMMMQGVLDNNAIGANDNFFLVGGHSLLGMQLVLRLRQSFGADLTLQQLFDAPTVKSLALTVEQTIIEGINALTDDEARTHLTE